MVQEKWTIIQPVFHHGSKYSGDGSWSNNSFYNLSKMFDARLYHIEDEDIELDSNVYHIINFDIGLIEKEIEFTKKVQQLGAKVVVGFSQDLRFLHGSGLMNSNGVLFTELCDAADGIEGGVSLDYYGRFQHKVIPMGEILEDFDFSVSDQFKIYDIVTSGSIGEEMLSLELEFLLMVKEKYPEKRVMSCIHGGRRELVNKLRAKYPQIEFSDENGLMYYLRQTKCYCNPEIRARPGRALMEAYYCRVPFVSSSWAYHSNLCSTLAYNRNDLGEMFRCYENFLQSDTKELVDKMEMVAQNDMFDAVYSRIKKQIFK